MEIEIRQRERGQEADRVERQLALAEREAEVEELRDKVLAELKRIAEEAGLRLPTTILPEGTALYDIGVEAQRRLQTKVEALPSLSEGLLGLPQSLRRRLQTHQLRSARCPTRCSTRLPQAGG